MAFKRVENWCKDEKKYELIQRSHLLEKVCIVKGKDIKENSGNCTF